MNRFLYLRPHELSSFITKVKILKKYDRISQTQIKEYEKIFTTIFKDTPYPFSWKLFYDRNELNITQEKKDMYIGLEKKVLFNHTYFPVEPNPPLPLSEEDSSSSST